MPGAQLFRPGYVNGLSHEDGACELLRSVHDFQVGLYGSPAT